MKIKVRPEDFIVDEIAHIPLKRSGEFAAYLLAKRGWNTVDALRSLSKDLGIPFANFSYGGKKDRYALTTQYISIKVPGGKHDRDLPSQEADYSLKFLGFTDRPMGPDLIRGNRFVITVRSLNETDGAAAQRNIADVEKYGYPNYFDDQRFGSYDPRQGFIAEKIIRGQYNGALKIYLTHIRPEDRREEKERRSFFFQNWGDWRSCLERARTGIEREAFAYLITHQKGFLPLLQRIPREEMSLFFSAYQSYLWNEIIRRIVTVAGKGSLSVSRGVAGDYLFYTLLDDRDNRYLDQLTIPTPASRATMPDALSEGIYSEVLRDLDVRPSMFNIRTVRQAFFKGSERKATIVPENISLHFTEDDLYGGRNKATIRFILPRGCYGTMLVKRLFVREKRS